MIITATQKNTRQTPRKVRLVANTVKKLTLEKALQQLAVIERRSTLVILKTIKQAMANAINNHGYGFSDLELKNIIVTEGPTYKRFRAVSRGRGHGVFKRTSHITVVLNAGDSAQPKVQPPKPKLAAPVKKTDATSLPTEIAAQAADLKNSGQKMAKAKVNTKVSRTVRNKSSI